MSSRITIGTSSKQRIEFLAHVDRGADHVRIIELRAEYDLATLKGRVQGKYYARATAGTTMVPLEPDVAEAFSDGASVNQALCDYLRTSRGKLPIKARQPAGQKGAPAWSCGCGVILPTWWVRWRRLAVVIREASPAPDGRELKTFRRLERICGITRPVSMVASNTSLEPGVFGVVCREHSQDL